jgi:hypothetical protein
MLKSTVSNDQVIQFKYKWYSRFFWIPWCLGWFLLGVYVAALAVIREARPEAGEIVLLWSLLLVLIAIGFVLGRRITIILRPIQVANDGVNGEFRGEGFEYRPKSNPGFIGWVDIEKFEAFSYPDIDSLKMGKKSGVRLISKKGEKIVIYEHINNYGQLLAMMRSRFESR